MNQIQIVDAHQYNGENAGEIQRFANNQPITDAPKLTVEDPSKKIYMQVYDQREQKEYRKLCWVPGDWAVKDPNGHTYSMSDTRYNQIMENAE